MGFIRKSRQQNNYTPTGGRVPGRPVDAAHRQSKPQFYDWAKDPEFAPMSVDSDPTPAQGIERPRLTGRGKITVSIDPILESKWGPGAKGMLEDTLRGKKRDGN